MSRALDVLVAEKFFELEVTSNCYAAPTSVDFGIGSGGWDGRVPDYSTKIEDAWKIVEFFQSQGYLINMDVYPDGKGAVSVLEKGEECCWESVYLKSGESLPMALCRTALAFKGVECP